MDLSLDPESQKMIEDRVQSGQYESATDVVRAALTHLADAEEFGDFAPGELDALIAEGEESARTGGTFSSAEVSAAVQRSIDAHRARQR